jgi:arylformamidase
MSRNDPAWYDTQYNNRARVADAPKHLEHWAQASALARDRLSRRLDVPYGSGPSETLDVFPSTRAQAPVFVFIHGGYWRALDKRDASFVAPALVDAGAMVVVPNYALAPGVSVETIVMQQARAVAWTWRNAELYGGDPGRIVVGGHSAGGHLAAMMLSCLWPTLAKDLPARLVHSALSISGVFDLEPVRHAPFLQTDLKLTPESVRRLSPVNFPAPASGVLHAFVGGNESEEFVRQNGLLRAAWGERNVPVCETVPGTDHFTVLHELVDPAARLHASALRLLGLSAHR